MFTQQSQTQISEIRESVVLRVFGFGLAFGLGLTYWQWVPWLKNQGPELAICWPSLPFCGEIQSLFYGFIPFLHYSLLLFFLVALISFLGQRMTRMGYWCLALGFFVKAIIYSFDYQLINSVHLIHFLAGFTFLFVPNKIRSLRFLVVGFYFFSGLFKIHKDWLSGLALGDFLTNPQSPLYFLFEAQLIPVLTILVVLIEMVVSFGLLAMSRRVFWGSFLTLLVYHALSYFIVGMFPPAIMAALLLFFPVHWFVEYPSFKTGYRPIFEESRISKRAVLFLFLFCFSQVWPKLFWGSKVFVGENRAWLLVSYDTPVICRMSAFSYGDESVRDLDFNNYAAGGRGSTQCDPYIVFFRTKKICDRVLKASESGGMHFQLYKRRRNESKYMRVVNSTDFCSQDVTYKSFMDGWSES
ncbi:MAG: HTTM domain-containing protein [Pseudomonadota bacterium]